MKEFKIQIPEGYEIDRENSTFKCIKFKPIENITYEEIARNVNIAENGYYYIDSFGHVCLTKKDFGYQKSNNSYSKEQLKRILALNQLLNIAEYYNSNAEERDTCGYAIIYDSNNAKFTTSFLTSADVHSCGIVAIFNNEGDAQAVINNPNFREILNTIYK